MQAIDRRKFNTGLFLGFGLAGCVQLTPEAPDLIVTGLRWSEDDGATWHTGSIQAGSNVWFEADVKNQGTGPTPDRMVIGVGFRANGTMVAWSNDHTTVLPAGQTVRLRANGGPDGYKYWNNAPAGSYTIRAHVDEDNRIPNELDKINNRLDVPVSVLAAVPARRVTIGSLCGGGNIFSNDSGSHKITDLEALHCGVGRLALHPDDDYWYNGSASPSRNDAVVLALLKSRVKPYVIFEWRPDYDSADATKPNKNYTDWFAIGAAFTARFRPNSNFLTDNGISDFGITEWSAINEPDHASGENGTTYVQYHDMLAGLADGVHSVDPTGKVYPAGYLSANRDQQYTGHGYLTTIADLINDSKLAGFDLHTYHDMNSAPIHNTYNRSHQRDFERCIAKSGITRLDIDWVCTEHNFKADPIATAQGYNEATARNLFLTHFFDVHGVVRSDGLRPGGVRLAWNIWRQSAEQYFFASQLTPRVERWCGLTHSMLLRLLHDMHFVANDPKGTGTFKLVGGGKTAWVFQNIHPSWSSLFGSSFTIPDIPAVATRVDVHDGLGLMETVHNPGTTHTFPTPTGKSYLFIADAETLAPMVS